MALRLSALDMGKLEILNLRVQQLAAAPGSPVEGLVYYDTVLHDFLVYNATTWVSLTSGGFTQEQIEDIVGALFVDSAEIDVTYSDPTPSMSMALVTGSVANSKLQDMAAATIKGRASGAGTGVPTDLSGTQVKTILAIVSTDLSDFTEAVQDVMGAILVDSSELDYTYNDAGNAETIAIVTGSIANSKLATMPANTIHGNNTGGAVSPINLTTAQVKTMLAIVPGDVTGFDTQVRTNRLDQMAAPTAAVPLNAQKITGLADPTTAQDAATKAYVDAAAAGIDWKASVRAATTANIATLAGGAPSTLDGVTLVVGDRILVKDQTTASQNGIYTVTTLGTGVNGTWTRATDADASTEVTSGLGVFVEEGTLAADTGWTLVTNNPIVLATTSLSFVQFTSLGQVTAGNGLTKTGSTLDVNVDASSIEINADILRVKAGGVTDAMLASTFAKVYTGTIGNAALTSIPVTHGLGHQYCGVTVYDASTGALVECDVVITSSTVITFIFAVAPGTNAIRVVIVG